MAAGGKGACHAGIDGSSTDNSTYSTHTYIEKHTTAELCVVRCTTCIMKHCTQPRCSSSSQVVCVQLAHLRLQWGERWYSQEQCQQLATPAQDTEEATHKSSLLDSLHLQFSMHHWLQD